jgi:hypothetical protein
MAVRVQVGVSAVIGQRRERGKEHFVGAELRRQNPLKDESLVEDVDHPDKMLRRHRQFTFIS